MHGNKVVTPLNVTSHDFLVILKEAVGLTIITSPTVEHSMTDLLNKINGTSPLDGQGQEDRSSTMTDAAHVAAAAAATLLAGQLTTAESAVTLAATHLKLMQAIAEQARIVSDKAMQGQVTAQEALAVACHAQATAIDAIDIAITDELQCVAELNAINMDTKATTKSQLANGAQALTKTAACNHEGAVNVLNSLHECMASTNATEDGGSVRTQGMMATPRLTSTISTTLMMAMATVTPGSILPGNDFRRAASMLHTATALAIHELNAPPASKDAKMNPVNLTVPMIGGCTTIVNALKTLLDNGIIKPLQIFHAHITNNEQDHQIMKATVEPSLEEVAARIAAVVEAKCPANRPTLKGLIHNNVDKTMEELRHHVQSLEAKLGDTNAKKAKAAKNRMGSDKKKKLWVAVAPSIATPKSMVPKSTKKKCPATKKKPTSPTTKKKPTSPAANNNASETTSKNSRMKATTRKSGGKRQGKSTAARN